MLNWLQDLRYASRLLWKRRGLTLAAVLTLALGFGANLAIFAVVDAVLLRPLPFADPDRLVAVWSWNPHKPDRHLASTHDVEDWTKQSQAIESIGVWRDWHFTLQTSDGPQPVASAIASPGLFQALAVQPVLGRLIQPADDLPGRNRVIVVSSAFWKRQFGADPAVIGRTLVLDTDTYQIVGVLPETFDSPSLAGLDIWAPNTVDPDLEQGRWLHNRRVVARLRSGVSLETARAELRLVGDRLAAAHPDTNADWTVMAQPLLDEEVGAVRAVLLALFAAVGLVMLIGCVNVTQLLLALVVERRSELAVRAALGARPWALARLLIGESALLCGLGAAAALLLSGWLLDALVRFAPPGLPRIEKVSLSPQVLTFTFTVGLLATLLVSIVPALQIGRVDTAELLKTGPRGPRRRARARAAFVVAETALSVALLIGAGLVLKSFVGLLARPLGFQPEQVSVVAVSISPRLMQAWTGVVPFFEQVVERVAARGDVTSAAAASAGPYFGGVENTELAPSSEPARQVTARYFNVTPNYFRTLGITLRRGRDFATSDRRGAPMVAIINRKLAEQLWPGAEAVGKVLRAGRQGTLAEVVGVVDDVGAARKGQAAEPQVYWPVAQQARGFLYLVIRTGAGHAVPVSELRRLVSDVEPGALAGSIRTMDALLGAAVRQPRFQSLLFSIFALLALGLAAVGILGVTSHSVTQRVPEIGIRMALGAPPRQIVRLVLGGAMRAVLAGAALGVVIAAALARLLTTLLIGVSTLDPLVFTAAPLLMIAVAAISLVAPLHRASATDPIVALRCE